MNGEGIVWEMLCVGMENLVEAFIELGNNNSGGLGVNLVRSVARNIAGLLLFNLRAC